MGLGATRLREQFAFKPLQGRCPQKILLDFDATDDPTHGDQEESYYHGYFKEHIYHPLLVFDGNTSQFISALLRAGNTLASRSTGAHLKRLVGLLRSA